MRALMLAFVVLVNLILTLLVAVVVCDATIRIPLAFKQGDVAFGIYDSACCVFGVVSLIPLWASGFKAALICEEKK